MEEKMKKGLGLSVIASLAILFIFAGITSAGTLEEITKRGELRVACQTQGAPFSFVDKNGERTGSSIELVEMIAKEMGVKVKFLNYDWDGLIPALLSKKADILAADMTPTLARATKIAFSSPYMYSGSMVVTNSNAACGSLEECKSKKDLKVAVLLGSTGESDAKKAFPNAEIKSYKGGGPLLLDAVKKGHADIAVNDGSSLKTQVANYPQNSFQILPEMLSKSPLSFAVRYDSQDLLQWMNLFFLHTELDGRLQGNLDYWVNSVDWKKDH